MKACGQCHYFPVLINTCFEFFSFYTLEKYETFCYLYTKTLKNVLAVKHSEFDFSDEVWLFVYPIYYIPCNSTPNGEIFDCMQAWNLFIKTVRFNVSIGDFIYCEDWAWMHIILSKRRKFKRNTFWNISMNNWT